MDHHEHDLEAVAARLRRDRPELTPLELDGLQRRIRSTRTTPRRNTFMKSRLAVTMMLVFGLGLSTAGAGLAVSGNSGSGNAAVQAYPTNTPQADVLGEVGEVQEDQPQQAAQPEQAAAAPVEQAPVTSEGSQLPFTGFAAGGVLFLGLVLLASGLVLRRRLSDQT